MKKKKSKEKWKKGLDALSGKGGGFGDIRRVKFFPGARKIRIAQNNYEDGWIHHILGLSDKGQPVIRRIVCPGKDICPICQLAIKTDNEDYRAKHRYYLNVIDRKKQKKLGKTKIMLLDVGPQIYEQIAVFIVDDEYGNPIKYDFKIIKTGKGRYRTSYKVIPMLKKPLKHSEEKALLKETAKGGPYNLKDFVAVKTPEKIKEIMLEDDLEQLIGKNKKGKKKFRFDDEV